MPRFTGQNKKRIDPRYFINETRELDEGILSTLGGLAGAYALYKMFLSGKAEDLYRNDPEFREKVDDIANYAQGEPGSDRRRRTDMVKKDMSDAYGSVKDRLTGMFREGEIPEEQITEEELMEIFGFGKKRDPKSGKKFDHEPLIADPENRDASGKVQPTASDMRRARKRGRDDAKRIFGSLEEGDPRMAAMMTLKPGVDVVLKNGEIGEIIDVIEPMQTFEVAINAPGQDGFGMFDRSEVITINDIDLDKLRPYGDLSEEDEDPYRNVPLDARPKTPEQRDKALNKQGYRHGLYGRKKNRYYDPEVQAVYLAAYERGVKDSKSGGVFGP